MTYFADPDFREKMLTFLCRDRNFLKRTSGLLEAKDFRPRKNETEEMQWIAERALTFWRDYGEPIGGMLRTEMLELARERRLAQRPKDRLMGLVERIRKG